MILSLLIFIAADFTSALELWKSQMLQYGRPVCEQLRSTTINDDNLRSTYYDFQRVAFQISDYTKDAYWDGCASLPRLHYRDGYVVANGGRIPGYWVFAKGLAEDYRRNRNTFSLAALRSLGNNAAYCNLQGSAPAELPSSDLSRESAYCLLLFLEKRKLGDPAGNLIKFRDYSRGHLDQWFVKHSAAHTKPFMVGLTAEALINYKERQNKSYPLIQILSKAGDELWSKFWDEKSQSFFYVDNPYPNDDGHIPAPDLNLLIAPMYGWLWKMTHNPKWRERGDKIFEGGVRGAWLGGGKQFNQNYRWSFDYIKWRAQ